MIRTTTRRLCVFVLLLAFPAPAIAAPAKERVLDDFGDAHIWTAVHSDQIDSRVRAVGGKDGASLCLDFDFHGVSGYAGMQRDLPLEFPANYEFRLRLRGDAPLNDFQFKLIDASGANVWWVNRRDVAFPQEWTEQRFKKRQISFAWGPSDDRELRKTAKIEFTIYAGKGGKGEACFDRLTLSERPLPPTAPPKPAFSASSGTTAELAGDGDSETAWRSDAKRSGDQWLRLDLREPREFGGLVLHWLPGAQASDYDVQLSDDAKYWRTVRRVRSGNGGDDPLLLPESESRYIRLLLHDGPARSFALAEIEIEPLEFGSSPNAFFSAIANSAPRGRYPRGFIGEQTYWTVVGIDGGHESGLLSEDGALEVAKGGFSIEPFVLDGDHRVVSWADVSIAHSLADGYLPMPSVIWSSDDIALDISAFGSGTRSASRLVARYALTNRRATARTVTLALAVRPFQVNPAVQFLNTPGGVSPIRDIAWSGEAVSVNGTRRVFPLDRPQGFFASTFDAGMVSDRLSESPPPTAQSVHDDTALASGVLLYRIDLPAHATRSVTLDIPLDGAPPRFDATNQTADAWYESQRSEAAEGWRNKLDGVGIRVPAAGRAIADTLRTTLAHILINRDGPAIRPGTRSYARSWIRDGAMTADALLRLGHADVVRAYLDWYAPYQFASGKVPCCVDARGSDPVAENDSHGELIHLIAQSYRYSGDKARLRAMWPHVENAIRYMDELRASERTDAKRTPELRANYGLLPASISHEGYSAKPMHSYWDDFWGLLGYKDAVAVADALGDSEAATRIGKSRDAFRADILASIQASVAAHHIDYIPGAAELGDYDPTSTTIVLSPVGEQANLPQDLLRATFERYWREFVERRDGKRAWKDYTPYELRNVSALLRLGWPDRALQALDFFLADRRPVEWSQWAEVVGRDWRESRFIGDMPHGWVASDFIRSALDLFAYERYSDDAIVLAAGIPEAWLDGDGIAIDRLRTPGGPLSYSLRRDGRTLRLSIHGDRLNPPPGGFVFAWPYAGKPGHTRLNGRKVEWVADQLHVGMVPAEVSVEIPAR